MWPLDPMWCLILRDFRHAQAVLLHFHTHTDRLKILLNGDSDSLGLEWGPRFCLSNKLPDAGAAERDLPIWGGRDPQSFLCGF